LIQENWLDTGALQSTSSRAHNAVIRVYVETGNVIGIAGTIQSQLHVIFAA